MAVTTLPVVVSRDNVITVASNNSIRLLLVAIVLACCLSLILLILQFPLLGVKVVLKRELCGDESNCLYTAALICICKL